MKPEWHTEEEGQDCEYRVCVSVLRMTEICEQLLCSAIIRVTPEDVHDHAYGQRVISNYVPEVDKALSSCIIKTSW
jgi:hypothetical protein